MHFQTCAIGNVSSSNIESSEHIFVRSEDLSTSRAVMRILLNNLFSLLYSICLPLIYSSPTSYLSISRKVRSVKSSSSSRVASKAPSLVRNTSVGSARSSSPSVASPATPSTLNNTTPTTATAPSLPSRSMSSSSTSTRTGGGSNNKAKTPEPETDFFASFGVK